jgi:hypothetical protein
VFENRVLRKIFGPKRDEMIGWRKLHNEELHNLYCSPSIKRIIKSRRMRWAGHIARMGRRGTHIGFWWESQKEREDNIRMDLREIGWGGMDWIDLAQDRDLVNSVMNLRIP